MLDAILVCYQKFESRINIISDTTIVSETEDGKNTFYPKTI